MPSVGPIATPVMPAIAAAAPVSCVAFHARPVAWMVTADLIGAPQPGQVTAREDISLSQSGQRISIRFC